MMIAYCVVGWFLFCGLALLCAVVVGGRIEND